MKKLTQEEFIERAKAVHGELYDYSKAVYASSMKKVIITCRKHGDFLQTPRDHIHSKAHCPLCGVVSKNEFISRSVSIHGNKYDYSEIDYVNANTPISLRCPECGEMFKQRPSHHMAGRNCPLCCAVRRGNKQRKTTEQFIASANNVHGAGRYSYDFVEYKDNRTPVKIICPRHGEFLQVAGDHLQGYGCRLCANELISKKKLFSKEKFIEKSCATHGDKYNYSLVDYKYSSTKVDIICKEHGIFSQAPSQHWAGNGCPTCAKYGFDITQRGVLYVLRISGKAGEFTGYGITRDYTTRLVTHKRFLRLSGFSVEETWVSDELSGHSLREIENKIHETFTVSSISKCLEGFRTESTGEHLSVIVDFIRHEVMAL